MAASPTTVSQKILLSFLFLSLLLTTSGPASASEVRKFPFPFVNMVAIMSDTDLSDKDEFEHMHRFLNTEQDCGSLGRGVGLDVGDTFWMDLYHGTDKDNWRINSKGWSWIYWHNGTKKYGDLMERYILGGWIDIPHTFFSYYIGADTDLSIKAEQEIFRTWGTTSGPNVFREEVEKVLGEWKRIGYHPVAWADHANNPWDVMFYDTGNLQQGADAGDNVVVLKPSQVKVKELNVICFPPTGEVCQVSRVVSEDHGTVLLLKSPLRHAYAPEEAVTIHGAGQGGPRLGAVKGSPYYCMDLILRSGIKFFWIRPGWQLAKRTGSGSLGFESSIAPFQLPDAHRVWGFYRYYEQPEADNDHLGRCVDRILAGDDKGGPLRPGTYCIVTTHLGYGRLENGQLALADELYKRNGNGWFNAETVKALRRLRAAQDNGRILVARTSRLLRYNLVQDMLSKYHDSRYGYTREYRNGIESIVIHEIHDDVFGAFRPEPEDLRGITFYTADPARTRIFIGDRPVSPSLLQVNPADETGLPSIGFKWFPPDTTDYTRK